MMMQRKEVTSRDTKRQATQHGCLPTAQLAAGDGDKGKEIVYGEEKYILYWTGSSSQGRPKIYCTGMTSPTI
jgi:hypothetical protein